MQKSRDERKRDINLIPFQTLNNFCKLGEMPKSGSTSECSFLSLGKTGMNSVIKEGLLQKLLPKFFEDLRCNIANQTCTGTLKLRINSFTPSICYFLSFQSHTQKKPQSTFCNPFLNNSVLAVSKSLPGQTDGLGQTSIHVANSPYRILQR